MSSGGVCGRICPACPSTRKAVCGSGGAIPRFFACTGTRARGNMQQVFLILVKVLLDKSKNCGNIHHADAAIAHLVERHLAKVEVASSSLVGRSTKPIAYAVGFFLYISAGMVELADTLDLGSSGKPCRFKSCCPHQKRASEGMPSFGAAASPRYDPLRSIMARGNNQSPLALTPCETSLARVCPGVPKRRESEQDSLLFGAAPLARMDPLRSIMARGNNQSPLALTPCETSLARV